MGYQSIDNLYKNQTILQFKRVYVTEKIHGTSAHIAWKPEGEQVVFFSGGETHSKFVALFDEDKLRSLFKEHFPDVEVTIFGEAYGGKQQGMKATYGDTMKFIAFDVKVGETWLNVPNANDVAKKMELEFVDWEECDTEVETLNHYRDMPSRQAKRNGIEEDKIAEGIVIRPIDEYRDNRGNRVMAKHKRHDFSERKTPQDIDEKELAILKEAHAIAHEWVTPMRLAHVLDKLGNPSDVRQTGEVIKAMVEDVLREAEGEIEVSPKAKTAIGRETAKLYKLKVMRVSEPKAL